MLINEEYDRLMHAIAQHNLSIPTSAQNVQEAQYIVDGIKARNN